MHLDPDMHTVRKKASGMAYRPRRGGLGRGRYIEVAGDRVGTKAAMWITDRAEVLSVVPYLFHTTP